MSRWKLRSQVAFAAGVGILIGVVALGVALQLLLARDLRAQLDRSLRQRATDVAALSATTPALLKAPGSLDSSASSGTLLIELVDRHGGIVARSLSLRSGTLPGGPIAREVIADGRPRFADASFADNQIRLYAAPLPRVGGGAASGGAVVVASSTQQVDHTLHRLRTLTLLAGFVAALVAAAAALVLTRRTLRPLERLAVDARLIGGTGDPSQRVAQPQGPEEIASLAVALNGMLEALERSRDAELRFLADASHELRTPLTALRGNAAYLARHAPEGEAFADLEADIARLGRLVDALLAVAREDAAVPPSEEVRLAEAVAEFADDPQVRVEADGELRLRGDRAAITRAVANLVANAKLYGPQGQPVTVRVQRSGDEAVVSVSDQGEGIPPELAEQASTRFWRGPGSAGREGSGLGLALVRATAERHGGRLVIDGATVSMVLPLRDSSESSAYTAGDTIKEG
jgi:two-component system, OmpR family, sensor kinase